MEWRIWIEADQVDPDKWDGASERLLEALEDMPDALGPVGWGRRPALGAVFMVDAPAGHPWDSMQMALAQGMSLFGDAIIRSGVGPLKVTRMEISDPEDEAFEGGPTLLGASDIAKRLDLSRQRIYQLARRADFPKPAAELERGAVWRRRDIDEWVRMREERQAEGASAR